MEIRLIFLDRLYLYAFHFGIDGSLKGLLNKKVMDRNDKKLLNCLTKTVESGGP